MFSDTLSLLFPTAGVWFPSEFRISKLNNTHRSRILLLPSFSLVVTPWGVWYYKKNVFKSSEYYLMTSEMTWTFQFSHSTPFPVVAQNPIPPTCSNSITSKAPGDRWVPFYIIHKRRRLGWLIQNTGRPRGSLDKGRWRRIQKHLWRLRTRL